MFLVKGAESRKKEIKPMFLVERNGGQATRMQV